MEITVKSHVGTRLLRSLSPVVYVPGKYLKNCFNLIQKRKEICYFKLMGKKANPQVIEIAV